MSAAARGEMCFAVFPNKKTALTTVIALSLAQPSDPFCHSGYPFRYPFNLSEEAHHERKG
jgi:hypothetical protein